MITNNFFEVNNENNNKIIKLALHFIFYVLYSCLWRQ